MLMKMRAPIPTAENQIALSTRFFDGISQIRSMGHSALAPLAPIARHPKRTLAGSLVTLTTMNAAPAIAGTDEQDAYNPGDTPALVLGGVESVFPKLQATATPGATPATSGEAASLKGIDSWSKKAENIRSIFYKICPGTLGVNVAFGEHNKPSKGKLGTMTADETSTRTIYKVKRKNKNVENCGGYAMLPGKSFGENARMVVVLPKPANSASKAIVKKIKKMGYPVDASTPKFNNKTGTFLDKDHRYTSFAFNQRLKK